jgi:phage repressor protein C with HTH and peptisase S24 domain
MRPAIRDGDVVAYRPTSSVSDGLHLIRLDGTLVLRKVQRKPGRRLRLFCLHDAFEDSIIQRGRRGWETVQGRPVDFEVVGDQITVV